MKKGLILLAVLAALISLSAQTGNSPFSEYGYNKQIMYTSSKGEFAEFHDQTDIVEIGTVLFNTCTNQVVGFVSEEQEKNEVSAATPAMTIDPLCEKYYWISPYAFCLNNPVRYTDPTGEFPIETIWDIGNVVYDIGAAVVNHIKGDHKAARSNWGDLGMDVGAMLIPYVPAGASKVIKATDKAIDATKAVDNATDAAKAVDKTAETSRAARREAMRDEGIPTSQQPKSQSKNDSGREYQYDVPKEGGGTQTKSVQQQTKDRSHSDQPHWEAGKVKPDDWGNTRMNNYGRPKLDSDKSKVNY